MSRFIKVYIIPGLIFQSLVIGGGYGTGRELVEFFLKEGPAGGLLGMLVSTAIWSLVLALSFEWARISRSYDYRSFINGLLGKGWIAYESVYFLGVILVVSVLGSAAGELTHSIFNLPSLLGIVLMMIGVGILAYFGSKLIERVLSAWSVALYLVYIILIVLAFANFGDVIWSTISISKTDSQWFLGGVRYSAYNVGILPAILFIASRFESRGEAIKSGIAAGVFAMIPGLFIYISLLSQYPQILTEPIPADFLLNKLNFPVLTIIFQVILFGTFIETGVALVHGFNERVSSVYKERKAVMPPMVRLGIAVFILTVSIFVADLVGIVDLIAKGYNALTWGYMVVFVIPVVTLGLWKILNFKE